MPKHQVIEGERERVRERVVEARDREREREIRLLTKDKYIPTLVMSSFDSLKRGEREKNKAAQRERERKWKPGSV